MPIVAGFLKQTVSWERRTSNNDWGDPVFAAPLQIRARIDERSVLANPTGGRDRLQETRVLVGPENDVNLGDRLSGEIAGRPFEGYVQGRDAIVLVNGKLDGYSLHL